MQLMLSLLLLHVGATSDEELPGPAQLATVMSAASEYAHANLPTPPKKRKSTPVSDAQSRTSMTSPAATFNSVVHLLESTNIASSASKSSTPTSAYTSTSTSPFRSAPKKSNELPLQCRHCSWLYQAHEGVADGEACQFCDDGVVAIARVGATMNSHVYQSVLEMQRCRRLTASSTPTSHKPPKAYSNHANVPDEWPPGKNCDICNKVAAEKYCASCKFLATLHQLNCFNMCTCNRYHCA
jgi:hypothetical protein